MFQKQLTCSYFCITRGIVLLEDETAIFGSLYQSTKICTWPSITVIFVVRIRFTKTSHCFYWAVILQDSYFLSHSQPFTLISIGFVSLIKHSLIDISFTSDAGWLLRRCQRWTLRSKDILTGLRILISTWRTKHNKLNAPMQIPVRYATLAFLFFCIPFIDKHWQFNELLPVSYSNCI